MKKLMSLLNLARAQIGFPQLMAWLFAWAIVSVVIWSTQGMAFTIEGDMGPRFFPVLLSVCLMVLNILYGREVFSARHRSGVNLPCPSDLIRPGGFVLVAIFIILFWERLGAVPTVWASSFLELRFLEGYSYTRSVLVSSLISALTWALFQLILDIPLPVGVLGWLTFPW